MPNPSPISQQTRIAGITRQVARLEYQLKALQARSDQLSSYRVLTFGGGAAIALALAIFVNVTVAALAALMGIAAFGVTVHRHRRVMVALMRHRYTLHHKQTQLARLHLDWERLVTLRPPPTPIPLPPNHPFGSDLDVIGPRSLHELIDICTTVEGRERLAAWLLSDKVNPDTIQRRQTLIRELLPQIRFREELHRVSAVLPDRVWVKPEQWHTHTVLKWLYEKHERNHSPLLLRLLIAFGLLNLLLVILTTVGQISPWWIIGMVPYILLYSLTHGGAGDLFGTALRLRTLFTRLQTTLHFLESYPYRQNSVLRDLCAPLLAADHSPTHEINRLSRLLGFASVQRNPILWLAINLFTPYDQLVAQAIQRQQARLEQYLPTWIEVLTELEALNALVNLAYLNPDYTFPTLSGAPVFRATQLGHPLIHAASKVTNDFALTMVGNVVIITGSNMAGKSSFLRTIGINTILAYAGSVVNADRLEVGQLRLFTCIKVSDSLADGISYFYAEVKRLKALMQALEADHELPLCFLIDEIFRGTNNRERLIGSRAYIRSLVGKNGFGLISTHDLELIKLADEIPPIRNMHFREEILEGQMVFDYTLREGPCPTTNALRIMEMEGLIHEATAG